MGFYFQYFQNNFLHPSFNLKYIFCVNVVEIDAVLDMKNGGYGHADIKRNKLLFSSGYPKTDMSNEN